MIMENEIFVKIMGASKDICIKHNQDSVKFEHFLYGVFSSNNNLSKRLRDNLKQDYDKMLSKIEDLIITYKPDVPVTNTSDDRNIDNSLIKLFNRYKDPNVSKYIKDVIIAILKNKTLTVCKILNSYGISVTAMEYWDVDNKNKMDVTNTSNIDEEDDVQQEKPKQNTQSKQEKSRTPALDSFGIDLNARAKNGTLEPLIGRDEELNRVCQTLLRKGKSNAIIIGDAGAGKTSIVEGLALRIFNKTCPQQLLNKRVISLQINTLIAGAKYRGQLEERVKSILEECKQDKNIILFIDEIHTVLTNASGSSDISNSLKPALARGEIQCIGATTLDEYKVIEKDSALDRRFQKIIVNPTNKEETRNILFKIKENYEKHHNVSYTDDSINEIIKLTDRYITNRAFPDKAIDVMDEAGAKAQLNIEIPDKIKKIEEQLSEIRNKKSLVIKTQKYEQAAELRDEEKKLNDKLELETKKWEDNKKKNKKVVNPDLIQSVVSSLTGIPVTRLSTTQAEKVLNIENILNSKVIGQTESISKISRALKRNSTGLKKGNRPIAVFSLLGSTGIGKTLIAKTIAKEIYGTEDSLITIDMGEYSEKFNVSRLIGAPPGYIGYNEGGQLTEKVKHKPYSVILLDEIEKAHPDVFDIFLKIFDEGTIKDTSGRLIDFRNTIIICTSNIGVKKSQDFSNGIGFVTNKNNNQSDIIMKEMKTRFKPEFINRMDDVIILNPLEIETIREIIKIELEDIKQSMIEQNWSIVINENIIDYIINVGYDIEYGARDIKRVLQRELLDSIADCILLNGNPSSGRFIVDVIDDKIVIDFK
jgi:ATP-dependent Clp protease ATP-binding subunit ClpC